MSTSRAKRTLATVAATGMAAAVATIGFSSQAAAAASCVPTLKDPVASPLVAGGTRIEWSVSCTGSQSYSEEIVAEVLYPGTSTPTVVARFYQLASSTGTAANTKILDIPVHISYACVTIQGKRYCTNDKPPTT